MKTITVHASKNYDILIGSGLLPAIGEKVTALGKVQKVCIVSDSTVFPIFGEIVSCSLENSGFEVFSHIIPAGEESKNGTEYLHLVNDLAQWKLTRSDILIALGGGVVGDLCGFAAASFLRGIRFVQIPTTLLAMVDSSVGGKTAIDLPTGKNLCGAFWQPSLVLCDTDTLQTLPPDIFRDGCAEVIKYGVLYDPSLFSQLEQAGLAFDQETIIARCIELKRNVVMEDEYDNGARMRLNLGHTIGHGVESYSNFQLSHGKSVAIGMAIVARASKCRDVDRIISCLERFGLPTSIDYPAQEIYNYTLSDKKRSGSFVNLIIPHAIGDCRIVPTAVEDLLPFIKEGM